MFIDTSAIVAILSQEEDAADLSARIEAAPIRLTSSLVLLEAAMRLSTKLSIDPMLVDAQLRLFLSEAKISLAPMDERTASLAIKAFADYGKGRGHPAQLNLADCLSYACAKSQGVGLLYKGMDFSHTDLA
ncbi:MAG: type II toxin-antitoxin system VapC family toxin [Rhizobiaceae bacterium]|nr:type II toxin-antitoxin system VapC family toxin [Rhizobiaceae bacterium]